MLSELVGKLGGSVHQLAVDADAFDRALIEAGQDADKVDARKAALASLDESIALRRQELEVLSLRKDQLEGAVNELRAKLAQLGLLLKD